MRKFTLLICSLAFSTATLAQGINCQAVANAQKLVGPAKTAFLKKCEAETKAQMTLVSRDKGKAIAPTSEFGHCGHDAKDL